MANYPLTTTTSFSSDIVLTDGGKVGIGTVSPLCSIHSVKGTESERFRLDTYSTAITNVCSVLNFVKSHTNTVGTLATTQDGELLGRIEFFGVNGTPAFKAVSRLDFTQEGDAGATTLAGKIDFITCDGSETTSRMVINKTGKVGIGITNPTSKLHVDGGDVEVDDTGRGLILRSPDGTRYQVTVANGGTLSVNAV